MPNFQGHDTITLQPGHSAVPYKFTFTACSAANSNDGSIPYGTSISSCVVTAHDSGDTDKTAELINSSSLSNNVVTVTLDYPSTSGLGTYHLKFVATLDTGAKIEFDFDRVKAKDL